MARERIPRAPTRNNPEGLVGASEVHDLSGGGAHTGLKGRGKEIGGHIDRHPIPRMRKGAAVESQNPVQEATSPISTGAQRVSQGQGMKGTPGPSLFSSELPLQKRHPLLHPPPPPPQDPSHGIDRQMQQREVAPIELWSDLVEPIGEDQEAQALVKDLVECRLSTLRRHSTIPLQESIRTLSRLARELPGHRGKYLSDHRPGLE